MLRPRPVAPTGEEVGRADCVVIATDHDAVGARTAKVVDLRDAVRRRPGRLLENVDVL